MARSDLIDIRAALLIQSVRFPNIYKVAAHHGPSTPPFAKKRANGTPPNLGGDFFRTSLNVQTPVAGFSPRSFWTTELCNSSGHGGLR